MSLLFHWQITEAISDGKLVLSIWKCIRGGKLGQNRGRGSGLPPKSNWLLLHQNQFITFWDILHADTQHLRCSPSTRLPMLGLWRPKLIIHIITFELTQHSISRHRQTERRTTYDSTAQLSHGKNEMSLLFRWHYTAASNGTGKLSVLSDWKCTKGEKLGQTRGRWSGLPPKSNWLFLHRN